MNYINEYEAERRSFKTVEFSLVPVGKVFYRRRPYPNSKEGQLEKIYTERRGNGWVNAKTTYGLLSMSFVPYDSKVMIEV